MQPLTLIYSDFSVVAWIIVECNNTEMRGWECRLGKGDGQRGKKGKQAGKTGPAAD